MKEANIKDVVLAITYNCNSRCQMCSIWKNTGNINFDPNLINNLPPTVTDLNISGGEPFLHPGITEIITRAKIKFPKAKIIISSNGFATDLIVARMSEILKVDRSIGVVISLDGLSDKHNAIRGLPNGFERAVKTIGELKKLHVKNIKIAFTLGDYNTTELKKVYKLAHDLNVGFTLSIVHSSDNYFGQENKIENKEDSIRALDWLKNQELKTCSPMKWVRAFYIHGLIHLIKNKKRLLPDYSGVANIFVDPAGKIYPNDVAGHMIGDLHNINFELEEIDRNKIPANWMMCTARPAIKRHRLKAISWIIFNKTISLFK
jgi:Fe-coproporphyrin III synthase